MDEEDTKIKEKCTFVLPRRSVRWGSARASRDPHYSRRKPMKEVTCTKHLKIHSNIV